MEEIDKVRADLLAVGDCILFDGSPGEIKEIEETTGDAIIFYSEDDREVEHEWHEFIQVFGYPEIDI